MIKEQLLNFQDIKNNNNKYDYNWIQIGEYLKSLNLLNKWENMKSNFDFFNLLNNIHRIHIII